LDSGDEEKGVCCSSNGGGESFNCENLRSAEGGVWSERASEGEMHTAKEGRGVGNSEPTADEGEAAALKGGKGLLLREGSTQKKQMLAFIQ